MMSARVGVKGVHDGSRVFTSELLWPGAVAAAGLVLGVSLNAGGGPEGSNAEQPKTKKGKGKKGKGKKKAQGPGRGQSVRGGVVGRDRPKKVYPNDINGRRRRGVEGAQRLGGGHRPICPIRTRASGTIAQSGGRSDLVGGHQKHAQVKDELVTRLSSGERRRYGLHLPALLALRPSRTRSSWARRAPGRPMSVIPPR